MVIPALDVRDVIGRQLDALAGQDFTRPWEVCVADNGSTDGTAEHVTAWRDRVPGLRVIDASERRTVSHARNVGVRASRGALVLLCDADDVVSPRWVSAMAEATREVDAVGGPLDLVSLNDPLARQQRPPTFVDGLERPHGFLPYAMGANCGFTRELFDAVDGFDEAFAGGGDDVDFFWRAQQAGFSIGFAPAATIAYQYRSGWRAVARQFYRYGRADPQLYRRFRAAGMPRPGIPGELARIAWLLVRAPLQAIPATRSPDWMWKAAIRAGRVTGSIHHRTLFI